MKRHRNCCVRSRSARSKAPEIAIGHDEKGASRFNKGLFFFSVTPKRKDLCTHNDAAMVPARETAFDELVNHGHVDVALNNIGFPPVALRNIIKNGNH